jgi:hypothetical protein
MSSNLYTNCQLINNAINLLLTTGLYQRPFEEWDRLTNVQEMWILLRTLIQEVFQCRLNATALTAGHHRYAPAQPFQQNAFGALANDNNDNKLIPATVATQVAALTYQSQLTQTPAANTIQRQEQQMAQIAAVQGTKLDTLHHIIAQLHTLLFNASNAGRQCYVGHNQGCTCGRGRGHNPPVYVRGSPQGGGFPQGGDSPPTMGAGGHSPGLIMPGPPGGFQGGPIGGPPPYHAPPPVMNGGYGQNGDYSIPAHPLGVPPAQVQVHWPQYSNVVKHYAN